LPDVITRVHPLKTSFNGIMPALAATFKWLQDLVIEMLSYFYIFFAI
jgi:hypothetical protein